MTIGIDCRLCGVRHAGIGRYIQNLVERLPALAPDIKWVYWFADQEQADAVQVGSTVTKLIAPIPHYSLAEQLKLPGIFARERLDLLHVPHFNVPLLYRGKVVVTIHDLLWHEQRGTQVTTLPKMLYWLKYMAYRFVATQAVYRAQRIAVPAKTIKATILRYYPQVADKILVTKEGATLLPMDKKVVVTSPKKTNLLYIGSLYPHKNLKIVFEAMALDRSLHLTVVGARSVFQDAMKKLAAKLGVTKQIRWAGFVADKDLPVYFAQATALIQPSLSEGFGLTGVEAMAAGVPVIASAIPIFQEIYGRIALLFDPSDATSLLRVVQKVRQLDRSQYRKKAADWVRQYSWDEMATETVAMYRSVLSQP